MQQISKQDYKDAVNLLRVGILRLHTEWQDKLANLLASPLSDDENAFDRSMEITKMSAKWHKESNEMEQWYRESTILQTIARLIGEGTLSESDIAPLSKDSRAEIDMYLQHWRR